LERISKSIESWEQYVPIKGEDFDKAIQLLQGLGIVDKCKEEGWNNLSDKVLQTLRVPFQSLIPFQFQPGQQSRIEWTANSSVAPVAGLTKNGLIKVKSNVGLNVREFCKQFGICVQLRINDFADVRSLCAGRTLLKDNPYIYEVMPLVDSNRAMNVITIALTCSYQKAYFLEGSVQKEKLKQLESISLVQAMALIHQNVPDAFMMLMIHHAIIFPEKHEKHWTEYLYQIRDFKPQASVVIAAHAIWLMAILPLTDKYKFQTYDYSGVGCGEEEYLTKVHGIVGTSRKMVYFQYLIRVASKVSTTKQ
jgi:hypothetical protein